MTANSLLTLREIAENLEINYNTLISCKKKFEDFLFLKNVGRTQKYPAIYTDFFRLVFALKDEGFVMPQIRSIILNNDKDLLPESLADWVSFWSFEVLNERMNERMNDLTNEPMNDLMNEVTNERMNDLTNESMNHSMNELPDEPTKDPREQINSDDQGNNLETDPDDFLTEQEKLDNQLSEFKAELMTEISTLLDQQLEEKINCEFKTLAGKLENHLSELQAQINGSLTQYYKAIQNIQEGLMSLNNRLSALEADLDTGSDQGIELYEIDLDDVQIKSPEINFSKDHTKNKPISGQEQKKPADNSPAENPSRHADIQYVRNSIYEGKPDRAAVIEWIKNEKYLDQGQSYGDLANKLNEAGIPTLRGRDNWGRTVVRGLVVKK